MGCGYACKWVWVHACRAHVHAQREGREWHGHTALEAFVRPIAEQHVLLQEESVFTKPVELVV